MRRSGHSYAGAKSQPAGYRFETKRYDQLHVIYVSAGQLSYSGDGGDAELGPGCLVLLRGGSRFTLSCRRTGYNGVCFVAAAAEAREFRGPAAALRATPGIRTLAGFMEREIASPGAGSGEVLLALGRAMAWHAIRLAARGASGADAPDYGRYWAECAREALDAAVYTGKGAREVLASLRLGYRQISRHFIEHVKMSPKAYQVRARVREAERLLTGTRLPVTAVAFELGYASSQHFATQFRAVTGKTPSAYRRRPARRAG